MAKKKKHLQGNSAPKNKKKQLKNKTLKSNQNIKNDLELKSKIFNLKSIICLLGLLIAVSVCFAPSLKNDFTNWDDEKYVLQNPNIELSFDHFIESFSTPVVGNIHPITTLSLSFDHFLKGFDAKQFHLTSLIFHVINTLLVFFFIYFLMMGNWKIALIVAFFFGIHPMHVESVAWISGRKDVVYTCFFLLGMIAYLQFIKQKKRLFYGLTFLFFILSVLAKPAAVVFPLILILLDFFKKRKLETKVLLEKIPFFAMAILMGIVTIQVQGSDGAIRYSYTFIQKICFASYGFIQYIFKMILPIDLSALYPYPAVGNGLPNNFYVFPFLACLILAIPIYILIKQKSFKGLAGNLSFGILFYLITVILVLQFVSVGGAIMADRYTYLPYLGLFFIVASFINLIKKEQLQRYFAGFLILIGFGFAYLSNQRISVWKNSETLWSNVLEQFDFVPEAYHSRGLFHLKNQKLDLALADFNRSIEEKKSYPEAYGNRASIYFNQDKFDLAAADYSKVIELKPNDEKAYKNRSAVYLKEGKFDLALEDLNKAIEINPQNGQSFYYRSLALQRLGNRKKAYQDALKAQNLGQVIESKYLAELRK